MRCDNVEPIKDMLFTIYALYNVEPIKDMLFTMYALYNVEPIKDICLQCMRCTM